MGGDQRNHGSEEIADDVGMVIPCRPRVPPTDTGDDDGDSGRCASLVVHTDDEADEIEQNPTVRDLMSALQRSASSLECIVCIDDGVMATAILTCCGARAHTGCLTRWMAEHRSCPHCRKDIIEPSSSSEGLSVEMHLLQVLLTPHGDQQREQSPSADTRIDDDDDADSSASWVTEDDSKTDDGEPTRKSVRELMSALDRETESLECAICLNDMVPATTILTCCGARVHVRCMARWMTHHGTCPRCCKEQADPECHPEPRRQTSGNTVDPRTLLEFFTLLDRLPS